MHEEIKEEIENSEENSNICNKIKKEKSSDISSDEMDSLEKLKKDMEIIGKNNNIRCTSDDEEFNEREFEDEEFKEKESNESKIENNNEFNEIVFNNNNKRKSNEILNKEKVEDNITKITDLKMDSIVTEDTNQQIFFSEENIKNNQIQTDIPLSTECETKKTKNKLKSNVNKDMLDKPTETTIKEKRSKKKIGSEKEDKLFKKSKKNEISEEEINIFVNKFKKEMLNAVNKDNQSNKETKPSFEKVNMVDSVSKAILNKKYQTSFLDNDILSVIKMWLEPLPDKTLPSYKVKSTLLELLLVVPVKKYHLIESKVGRIVFFYSKNERENKEIKRMAKKLVYLWTQVALKD